MQQQYVRRDLHSYGGDVVLDAKTILQRAMKYIIEGAVVALTACFIPYRKLTGQEVLVIALVAATTFSLLDLFAPSIAPHARMGVGFSAGASLLRWPS